MSMEPTRTLDRRMVHVWRLQEALTLLCTLVALIPAGVAAFFQVPALTVCCAALAAVQLALLVILPGLRYRRWRYEVTTTDVLIRSGLIVVKTAVIPMVRVQHVETKQGPILKHYGLASVKVTTAGNSFEIPGLAADEAERLRDQVAVLARIAQEDV